MGTCEVLGTVAAVEPSQWARLVSNHGPDSSQGYLLSREQLEPGTPVLVLSEDSRGPVAAMHGVLATPATRVFSDAWKLLTDEQFLRITPEEDPVRVRTDRAALVGRIAQPLARVTGHTEDAAMAASLAEALGSPLVIRGYDSSELLLAPGAGDAAGAAVIGGLQRLVQDGRAGAVVLPYVSPADTRLRRLLAKAGFVSGSVTASSAFDLSAFADYPAFLAAQPGRIRRHYERSGRDLTADGLRVSEVALNQHLDRIVELEVQTSRKNGSQPDRALLRQARALLADRLPSQVRVAVAAEEEVLACTVQLFAASGCCLLAYGCDYGRTGHSIAYHHLLFAEAISACIRAGVAQYRLGFEAFGPKRQRGARVTRRELWLWMADQVRLERLGRLLRFVDERNAGFLAAYE